MNRGKIRIYSDSKIENEFLQYDFSGYSLRSDQIIDFGIEPDMESLTFTTYQGTDWLDASKSHYFEVSYWNSKQTFLETINGPSWFSNFHYSRVERHEEYFYSNAGYPSFLIISWENYDFKVDGFKNYYYSLLIDATTETHSSRSVNYDSVEDQPWLKVSMQSVVGLGSNLSIPDVLTEISSMLKDIANQITVIELGEPAPSLNLDSFNQSASNSSPYSFIQAVENGMGWYTSDWFGGFYKSKPGWVYHLDFGWLFYSDYTPNSSWCWHPVFSWFWVSETTYPYVLLEDFSWSFIQKENNQILAYDFVADKWHMLDELIPKASDTFEERMGKIKNSFMSDSNKRNAIANYLLTGR